jgi:hypothetical protein
MNKEEKALLKVIFYDLDCMNAKELKGDNLYHFKLAKRNLKDLTDKFKKENEE